MRLHALSAFLVLALLAFTGMAPAQPKTAAKQSAPPAPQPARKASDTPGKPSSLVTPKREPREIVLTSMRIAEAPVIDGRAGESFWTTAPAITTLDYSSQRPITIRSVHTAQDVFFLVTFPAETASETHKTWVWDPKEEIYREGPDREDVFVFKWSMSGNAVQLRLRNPEPHRGDIWFWKAVRTNPSGFADDKWQSVSKTPSADSRKIVSTSSTQLHFLRAADAGKAPWDEKFFFEYQGPKLIKYVPTRPEGSRADIRAKGLWANKQWTIELGRRLNTGHDDDVVFKPGAAHLFGVACHAMAYDTPHAAWSQPLYRTGDVFDRLFLMLPSVARK